MGPPDAYHVGSEKRGTVKKTVKRRAQVMMPLCLYQRSCSFQGVGAGERRHLQRRRQKRAQQPNLLAHRHLQLGQNRPRQHQHRDIRHQTRNAVRLVKQHHIATRPVVRIHRLRPKVPERPAYREREDLRDHALQHDDDADADDGAAVAGHLEDLVVEEEGGELGEHDGGCVGELEDFGELEPGLEGGDGDGGDVVAYAAYVDHYFWMLVSIIKVVVFRISSF